MTLLSFSINAKTTYNIYKNDCLLEIRRSSDSLLIGSYNLDVLVWQSTISSDGFQLSDQIHSWSSPLHYIDNYTDRDSLFTNLMTWKNLCIATQGGADSLYSEYSSGWLHNSDTIYFPSIDTSLFAIKTDTIYPKDSLVTELFDIISDNDSRFEFISPEGYVISNKDFSVAGQDYEGVGAYFTDTISGRTVSTRVQRFPTAHNPARPYYLSLSSTNLSTFESDAITIGKSEGITITRNGAGSSLINGIVIRTDSTVWIYGDSIRLDIESAGAGKILQSLDASGWVKWVVNEPFNYNVVLSESDFGDTITGGNYQLTSGEIYRIVGNVSISYPIDVNGAILLGGDRTVDKISSNVGSLDMFISDGSVIATNLTLQNTGTGSAIFNLRGTTGFEYVYLQDVTIAAPTKLGTIDSFYAIQAINVPVQSPKGKFTLNDVYNISLRGFDITTPSALDTIITLTGTSSLVQIYYSGINVPSGDVGIEIEDLTLLQYGSIDAGVVFSGTGDYLVGTIDSLWEIEAKGVPTYKDEVSTAIYYLTSTTATTLDSVNVWRKVLGTTATVEDFRFTDGGVSNRSVYQGLLTHKKKVSADISFTAAGNGKVYEFAVYFYDASAGSGSIITHSIQSRKVGTGSDVGQMGVNALVEFDTGDYTEIWVRCITDSTDPTVEHLTVITK